MLVTIRQSLEGLTDRQAAEAVGSRIDWKYVLSLELTASGFDSSVLSEFRTRLVEGAAETYILDELLKRFQEQGWLKARGRQRSDSTHVLAAIRVMDRLELVGETRRATRNSMARIAPDWLCTQLKAYPKSGESGRTRRNASRPEGINQG
jgi:transposase